MPITSTSSATTVTESSSSVVSSIGAKSRFVGSSTMRTCRHPFRVRLLLATIALHGKSLARYRESIPSRNCTSSVLPWRVPGNGAGEQTVRAVRNGRLHRVSDDPGHEHPRPQRPRRFDLHPFPLGLIRDGVRIAERAGGGGQWNQRHAGAVAHVSPRGDQPQAGAAAWLRRSSRDRETRNGRL